MHSNSRSFSNSPSGTSEVDPCCLSHEATRFQVNKQTPNLKLHFSMDEASQQLLLENRDAEAKSLFFEMTSESSTPGSPRRDTPSTPTMASPDFNSPQPQSSEQSQLSALQAYVFLPFHSSRVTLNITQYSPLHSLFPALSLRDTSSDPTDWVYIWWQIKNALLIYKHALGLYFRASFRTC